MTSNETPNNFGHRLIAATRTKSFGVMSVVGILVISTCYVIFSDNPETDVSQESNHPASTSISDTLDASIPILSQEQRLSEPQITNTLTAESSNQRLTARTSSADKKPVMALGGPQLFLRTAKIKMVPGLIAKAVLLSGAGSGVVKAKLTEKLVHSGEEILQNGTILLGMANATEERLSIGFDKVVAPDGVVTSLKSEALDATDKLPGIKGTWLVGKSLKIAGSIGLNVLSGVAEGLQEQESIGGQVTKKSNLRNAILNGTSRTAMDEARSMMSSLKDNAPRIEIPEGQEILVLFQGSEN